MSKTKWILTKKQKEELKFLFQYKGWNEQHLSKKYGIRPESVHHHVYGLKRKVKVLTNPPEEIKHLYFKKDQPKTYEEYTRESEQRKKECEHLRWVKRCSTCGAILGSETTESSNNAISILGTQ